MSPKFFRGSTCPMRLRSSRVLTFPICSPRISTVPVVGKDCAPISLSMVVFPAPLGPRIDQCVPAGTLRSIPEIRSLPLRVTATPEMAIAAGRSPVAAVFPSL